MRDKLQHIIQEITRHAEGERAMLALVSAVQALLQAEVCALCLVGEDSGAFRLAAAVPVAGRRQRADVQAFVQSDLLREVGDRGELLNRFSGDAPLLHFDGQAYGSFLGAPLIHLRQLVGVLCVLGDAGEPFSTEAEAQLMTLATRVASLIFAFECRAAQASKVPDRQKDAWVMSGIPSAPGIAVGQAVVVYEEADLAQVPERACQDPEADIAALKTAIAAAKKEVQALGERFDAALPVEERGLFAAYVRMMDGGVLQEDTEALIRSGVWVQRALATVVLQQAAQFAALDDPYLQERATDIREVGRRILVYLQQGERGVSEAPQYPEHTILVGEEVTPTALARVPEGQLVGIFSVRGSTNSHVAILARALDVPAVMGSPHFAMPDLEDKQLVIDGYFGQVYVQPSRRLVDEFTQLKADEEALFADLQQLREAPAQTRDEYGLSLFVNTGLASDIHRALTVGADGVGLFRTEIPFMMRSQFPSEETQTTTYRQLIKAFAPRPVMIRTLDVGGDKALPYFPVIEDNPFLGWRGIRITLDHPEIFLAQLRALLRASAGYKNLHVMFPMVTTVLEIEEALRLLRQAYDELESEGLTIAWPAVGAMIEVPSAVYQAEAIARRVDFLSVGSNDLIQYLLAVDRNNARVDRLYDNCHPAVLQALQEVVTRGHALGKHVSICGEMAGDPISVMLLVAMGFDTLSMNATRLPKMKWVIRQFSMAQAKHILAQALAMEDPVAVRCLLEIELEKAGVGGLIRAGR